jgi:hypothetical protein
MDDFVPGMTNPGSAVVIDQDVRVRNGTHIAPGFDPETFGSEGRAIPRKFFRLLGLRFPYFPYIRRLLQPF